MMTLALGVVGRWILGILAAYVLVVAVAVGFGLWIVAREVASLRAGGGKEGNGCADDLF